MGIQKILAKFFTAIFILIFFLAFNFSSLTINELLYGISICTLEHEQGFPAISFEKNEKIIIAIDPGHGGEDTGAMKIIDEVEVINQTSTHLYTLLEENENFTPVLTKDFTENKTIQDRADYINEIGANLVISIHANSDSSKSTHGFECYPTPPGRTYSSQSMQIAQLITSGMQSAGHNLRGENGIKFAYYNNDNKTIVDSSDDKIRSSKSFGIVDKVNCPSILVEQCFISNYSDVENWTGEEGAKKSAEIYYKAICDYYKVWY